MLRGSKLKRSRKLFVVEEFIQGGYRLVVVLFLQLIVDRIEFAGLSIRFDLLIPRIAIELVQFVANLLAFFGRELGNRFQNLGFAHTDSLTSDRLLVIIARSSASERKGRKSRKHAIGNRGGRRQRGEVAGMSAGARVIKAEHVRSGIAQIDGGLASRPGRS